jgi:hypothetical protein
MPKKICPLFCPVSRSIRGVCHQPKRWLSLLEINQSLRKETVSRKRQWHSFYFVIRECFGGVVVTKTRPAESLSCFLGPLE